MYRISQRVGWKPSGILGSAQCSLRVINDLAPWACRHRRMRHTRVTQSARYKWSGRAQRRRRWYKWPGRIVIADREKVYHIHPRPKSINSRSLRITLRFLDNHPTATVLYEESCHRRSASTGNTSMTMSFTGFGTAGEDKISSKLWPSERVTLLEEMTRLDKL
jgi:hypothetical protein